jgi:hypothetical protein
MSTANAAAGQSPPHTTLDFRNPPTPRFGPPPPPRQASASRLQKAAQADVLDAAPGASSGAERLMCPTVAFHSIAKSWAQRGDGSPVLYGIAPTNNLVASECDDACVWNGPANNGTAEDVHFAIEYDRWGRGAGGKGAPIWAPTAGRLLPAGAAAAAPPCGAPPRRPQLPAPPAAAHACTCACAHPAPRPHRPPNKGSASGSRTSRPSLSGTCGATSASTRRAAWGPATYG